MRTQLRIFKTKWFALFVRKECIGDSDLAGAIMAIEKSQSDAELGSGLIKK